MQGRRSLVQFAKYELHAPHFQSDKLEQLSKMDVLVVDKTGTLTIGKPEIQNIRVLSDGHSENELLQIAASLNAHSTHPLANAFQVMADEQGIELIEAKQVDAESGKGIQGIVNGKSVKLGNAQFVETDQTIRESDHGNTISWLKVEDQIIGYFTINDTVKDLASNAINDLHNYGIEVVMLTGDNEATAEKVAQALGIDQYKANCLPGDKIDEVKRLQNQGKMVAVAGDGTNDAPALAQADIGIAMDTGTDVAIESADITLLKGDIMGVVKALRLSNSVMKNIYQNLFFAFVYNTVGIPIAAGLLYPIFGLLLSPMIAALAMSFSSVSVIANSLRLRSVSLHR